MQRLADSFWRACAYCLLPRVIGLSLLPLVLAGLLVFGFMFFFWEGAVASVRATLESWLLVDSLLRWLDSMGGAALRSMLAPLIVLALVLPVVVVISLLLVALCMTPAMVSLVSERRFPLLEKRRGGSLLQSVAASLGATVVAVLLLLLSLPLWLIPPLVMVLPPLIWGWLTYRVMAFDALAEHASPAERQTLLATHRYRLLLMGVVCGYLSAAPSLVWASGVVFAAAFWVLIPVAVWIYALVLAFSSLWFAHYGLAALHSLREHAALDAGQVAPPADARP